MTNMIIMIEMMLFVYTRMTLQTRVRHTVQSIRISACDLRIITLRWRTIVRRG